MAASIPSPSSLPILKVRPPCCGAWATSLYEKILIEHHRIVRGCLAEHGGREEGTGGDSFFATFTSPTSSVLAALDIQQELARSAWPHDERPRVRMGIHTGEASDGSAGLVGYEVHRAARIAAVGNGGQVLLL